MNERASRPTASISGTTSMHDSACRDVPETSASCVSRTAFRLSLTRRLPGVAGLALALLLLIPILQTHPLHGAEGRAGGSVSTTASMTGGAASTSGGIAEAFSADTVYERIESLFEHGGFVMWILLATSVFGATFAMERCFALRRGAHIPAGLTEMLREKLLQGGTLSATSYLEPRREGLARVLHGVLSRPGATRQEMERVLEDELSRALWDERRYIRPVGIVAQVAPLLGLLGTVIGLIGAFQQAAAHGMDDPTLFAGGIYQALYTTAFGLTISIPFLIAYQYLRSKADSILREIEVVSQRFVFALARDMSLPALQRASASGFSFAAHTPAEAPASPNAVPDAPASTRADVTPAPEPIPTSTQAVGTEPRAASMTPDAPPAPVSPAPDASSTPTPNPPSEDAASQTRPDAPTTADPTQTPTAPKQSVPPTAPDTPPASPSEPRLPDDAPDQAAEDPASALLEGDADSDVIFPEVR